MSHNVLTKRRKYRLLDKSEPRFRINASQSTKGVWSFNATVEHRAETIELSNDPKDTGNTVNSTLGLRLLSLIKETEKEFRADNRTLASDVQ